MIANPDKFKAIIIQKDRKDTSGIKLNINNTEILSEIVWYIKYFFISNWQMFCKFEDLLLV